MISRKAAKSAKKGKEKQKKPLIHRDRGEEIWKVAYRKTVKGVILRRGAGMRKIILTAVETPRPKAGQEAGHGVVRLPGSGV